MPRCRFQPDQWAQWIQDRSFSNFSVADFCANHQLPVHSFYFWRRKLASHSKPKKRKNLADAKLAENALQFIPLATSGLLAQVVVSKFGDHLPGYRQEDIFSRHGMEMRRCTLYDWVSVSVQRPSRFFGAVGLANWAKRGHTLWPSGATDPGGIEAISRW